MLTCNNRKHDEAGSSTCDHFTSAERKDKCPKQAEEEGDEDAGEDGNYVCGHSC